MSSRACCSSCGRTSSTRSITSISLIFPFSRSSGCSPARSELFDVQKLPRTADRCGFCGSEEAAAQRMEPAVAALRMKNVRPARPARRYRDFSERVKHTKRRSCSSSSRRVGGQDDRRLRRAGQGQHAAQLLRHQDGLPRLHGRPPTRTSRASFCRDAHSGVPSGPHTRNAARLRADSAWNIAQESAGANADIRAWGGRFVVPIPKRGHAVRR